MSGFFKLNGADFLRGLIVAVITAVLTIIVEALGRGGFEAVDWSVVGTTAALAAGGYLLKNLGTNTQGEVVGIKATAPPPAGDT